MNRNNTLSKYRKITQLFFCIYLLLQTTESNAQNTAVTLPSINPPSANATALGLYGEYPISYTNGVPEINIPIYEIKSSKLSLPISLSYHSNGIKVNELASTVGLGWSLNAGGAIIRSINDVSDFADNGFSNIVIPDESIPPIPGYNISPVSDEMSYYSGLVSLDPTAREKRYDGQPDNFFFNYASKSGQFMLKNTVAKGAPAAFTTIPYTAAKINFIKEKNRFIINDTDGTTYIFGNSIKDNSNATELTNTFNSNAIYVGPDVTAWYLTEMISADRSDTLSFKYQQASSQFTNYTTQVINQTYASFNVPSIGRLATFYTQVTQTSLDLSEIDFKGGKVIFEYGSRQDLSTNRLNRIRVYKLTNTQPAELKRFNFGQSYFTGSDNSGFSYQIKTGDNSKRLKLDNITEEGIDPVSGTSIFNPPYTFNYYGSGSIAYLGVYEQDLWGYWNGHSQGDLFYSKPPLGTGPVANRTVDPAHLIVGTMKSIQYPTGGKTEFQFEPNRTTRTYGTNDTSFVSYHITTLGTYGTQSTDLTFTAQNNILASLSLSVQNNCTSGNCLLNQPQVFIYDLTNSGQAIIATSPGVITSLPYNLKVTANLIQGHQYRMVFPNPGGDPSQSAKYRLDATLDRAGIQNITQTLHTDTVMTGGLRVKNIINKDFQDNILKTKRFNYLNPYYLASDIFSGDFSTIGNRYVFVQQGKDGQDYMRTYNENSTVPLQGSSNGSLAYQEVEEYNDDNNGNSTGKIVYNFNQYTDDNYDIYTSTKSNNAWKRNQLTEKRIYKIIDGNYTLIKDNKSTYTDLFDSKNDVIRSFVVRRKKNVNVITTIPGNEIPYSNFPDYNGVAFSGKEFDGCINGPEVYRYNIYDNLNSKQIIFKNALTSTEDIDYDSNGKNPVSNLVNYFYDNPDNLMASRTELIRSNHAKEISRMVYTSDYHFDQCGPADCYNNFLATLSSLKTDYYNKTTPVYNQWQQLATTRANIVGGCNSVLSCLVANNYNANDATIISLYNQYGDLKKSYNTSVAQAVNDYISCQSNYSNCNIAQINSSASPIKALLLMQQINMITEAEQAKTLVSVSDNNEYLLSAEKNTYQAINNIAEPAQIKQAEFPGNLLYSSYVTQPDSYLVTNTNFDNFENGNLIQYTKDGGSPNSYIWGYNKQYAVAEAKNALATDIYYDSFEEGNGNTSYGDSQTGHYSFSGNYTKQLSGLTNGSYILSYYKKTGNTWSLNLTSVAITNGSYSINLTGQIDDVRLHPSIALMSTYTYDPSIGITSMTDAKNNTTYYEYDAMQRLLNIRDESRNIVKHLDYHYQNH